MFWRQKVNTYIGIALVVSSGLSAAYFILSFSHRESLVLAAHEERLLRIEAELGMI